MDKWICCFCKGADDTAMASDPKVFYDKEQAVWVMYMA